MRTLVATVAAAALLLALALAAAAKDPIVPMRQDGFVVGSRDAEVLVDVFIDLQCPDCAASAPLIMQAAQAMGLDKVSVVYHTFALADHFQAFYASQLLWAVATEFPDLGLPMLFSMFKQQTTYFNAPCANMTRNDVYGLLANLAAGVTSQPASHWLPILMNGTSIPLARQGWALGVYNGVFSTPAVFINGIRDDDIDDAWTVQQWQSYFQEFF